MLVASSAHPAVEAILGDTVTLSAGSTATLTHQVEAGAPADLVVSAHPLWTARLAAGPGRTVAPLARNPLVMAWPADAERMALVDAPCVVTGDPESVPLGMWAKSALEGVGAWDDVHTRLHPTASARHATTALQAGACPVGILYASDAAAAGFATTPLPLPDGRVPTLDAVLLRDAGRPALERLTRADADATWARLGFVPLSQSP